MRPARAILFGVLVLGALPLRAQDPFEIQVYEYETVPKGRWNLETHVNYVSKGTTTWEGPMAPTEGQFHTTFELTRGITDNFELAGYLSSAPTRAGRSSGRAAASGRASWSRRNGTGPSGSL